MIEQVMVRACAVAGIEAKAPFRHMEYREAIRRYGIDKPDLRFGMELCDVTAQFAGAREKLRFEGNVQALVAPGAARIRASSWTNWPSRPRALGARGLYTVKVTAEGASSALEKTLGAAAVQAIVAATGAKAGDLILAVSAAEQIPGTDAAALIAGPVAAGAGRAAEPDTERSLGIFVADGLSAVRVEHQRKALGAGAASLYRHRRGGRRQAGIRAAGSALKGLRSGAERRGAWLGQHSDSQPGAASADVSRAWD